MWLKSGWQCCFCLLGKLVSCFRGDLVSPEPLWFKYAYLLCVFKWVLVKAFFLWNQFKVLAVRKIAKWFSVAAKPSFAFIHFSISTSKSFTQSPFLSLCSACFIFLFPFLSCLESHWFSHLPEKMSLKKKEKKTWRVGRDLEGLFIHIQWQKVCWGLLGLMCLFLIPSIYADHE